MRSTKSSVEVTFKCTHDGLVVDRITLHVARADEEGDLRRFAERVTHGVPGVDLTVQARQEDGK